LKTDGSHSIFQMRWWPSPIATAWVLTRNERFIDRVGERYRNGLGPIAAEAQNWRHDVKVNGVSLGRHPVMLFPTVESAAARLHAELPEQQRGFPKDRVLAKFPKLDDQDYDRVLGSLWRGQNPNDQKRVGLSHAAWWLASKRNTQAFRLDDSAAWRSAFDQILSAIVDGRVGVFATKPPPVQPIPADKFDGMPVEYPARASEHRLVGSPYKCGGDAFIKCDFNSDQYFAVGQREPVWSGLQVNSDDLLKLTDASHVSVSSGHWNADKIKSSASNYLETAESPNLREFEAKLKAAGHKGNRKGVREAYQVCFREKFGAPSPRGRRRKRN
jgi:hypothetical protein